MCDYDDYMMDIMTSTWAILLKMIRVILIVNPMCRALLNQMIMSCIMIFMGRITVGNIVYIGVRLV